MKLVDFYILRQFVFTLVFSLIALYVIFLVVNVMENLEDFLDNNAELEIIGQYYLYSLPGIFKLMTPVAMLLATLFSIGKLSGNNEITAMKSGGLSLYRMMFPLLLFSVVISVSHLYFNGWIVPKSNSKVIDIESEYLKKTGKRNAIFNLYFRESPTRNLSMKFYNANIYSGNNAAVEWFNSENNPRLIRRIEAQKIVWDTNSGKWLMLKVIDRKFNGFNIHTSTFDSLSIELKLTHDKVVNLKKRTEEMTFDELYTYIQLMGQGGKDVRQQMTDYYGQYAFPFANIVVIIFGVPFASIRKKGGMAIQIGAAMIISFFYLIFTKIGQTIGYSSDFDPVISGWLANMVFLLIGIVVIIKTKT